MTYYKYEPKCSKVLIALLMTISPETTKNMFQFLNVQIFLNEKITTKKILTRLHTPLMCLNVYISLAPTGVGCLNVYMSFGSYRSGLSDCLHIIWLLQEWVV